MILLDYMSTMAINEDQVEYLLTSFEKVSRIFSYFSLGISERELGFTRLSSLGIGNLTDHK